MGVFFLHWPLSSNTHEPPVKPFIFTSVPSSALVSFDPSFVLFQVCFFFDLNPSLIQRSSGCPQLYQIELIFFYVRYVGEPFVTNTHTQESNSANVDFH